MPTDRVAAFRRLHEGGCFVIPNPWDVGSARLLAGMGFPALATTSSGFAWTLGRPDNHVTLDEALSHFRVMVSAVDVPVSGDFEKGFAAEPDAVATHVGRAAATGLAGLSIEDSTGDESDPLFAFPLAVERVRAARRAIDSSGSGLLLTARSEGFIVGRSDLAGTLRRLEAYADAGADCLYAPGIRSMSDIAALVHAVEPKPVNVVVGSDFATVAQLADIGVRRIQRGRRPCPRGVDRISRGRDRDRARRDLRRPRAGRAGRRIQRALPSSGGSLTRLPAADGQASMEFLDAGGRVVQRVGPAR